MKTTYKFSEMLEFLSCMHFVSWNALDSYSDVPYTTKNPEKWFCDSGRRYLKVAEESKSVDSSEIVVINFDECYVKYQLESMQSFQTLVFPIYYGCNFQESYTYKFSNNVFVLIDHYRPD